MSISQAVYEAQIQRIADLQVKLAEAIEARDIAEANLARLQDRWDARPATEELDALIDKAGATDSAEAAQEGTQ